MDFKEAFEAGGFVATEPTTEKARQQHFSYLECEVPAEIRAFYEHCNGGSVDALSCRAYPLAQAATLVGTYDFHAEFRFLPFFVADDNASDPAMVGLEPPLTGYVFQICHDDRSRMLAPSIPSFLQSLASQPEVEFFHIEESTFVYPRALSESEQETVDALIARSMTELEEEYEAQLLVELALSMLTDEACIDLLRGLNHPDSNARFVIKDRLQEIGTPAAEEILAKADDELKAFVARAIDVLKKEGFDAATASGTDLRVAGKGLNVGPSSISAAMMASGSIWSNECGTSSNGRRHRKQIRPRPKQRKGRRRAIYRRTRKRSLMCWAWMRTMRDGSGLNGSRPRRRPEWLTKGRMRLSTGTCCRAARPRASEN